MMNCLIYLDERECWIGDVFGFVCEIEGECKNNLKNQIVREISIIGFDEKKNMKIYQICFEKENCDIRNIEINQMIFIKDCKIQIEDYKRCCLKFVEDVSEIYIGEAEIIQNKSYEFCCDICKYLQDYRKIFNFFGIMDREYFMKIKRRINEEEGNNRIRRKN